VRKKYQRKERESNHKFEVVRGQELMVRVPLPMAEVWAEMQAQVEELTGQAGLEILRAILENEVTRRAVCAGESSRVTWSSVDKKSPLERPRARTEEDDGAFAERSGMRMYSWLN
jgi:hypothetical protein